MLTFFQHIQKIKQQMLFNPVRKILKPLLSHEEILALSLQTKNNKSSSQSENEIAFKQAGDIRSIYRGHGIDYEESRHYQAGDDPRYMNWQLSARTGQHYMKVFREEKQPGVFILVDRRQTMCFGTQKRLKVTQAVRAAAIAAFSAKEKNYSIGGVIIGNVTEWFKERNSKQAAFNFINQAASPATPAFEKETSEKNINDILLMLDQVLTAGSIVYLVSDFHDLDDRSQSILLQLSASHQINAIQITDIAEVKLPDAGVITLKSSTQDKPQRVNSNSFQQQKLYQSAADQYFNHKKSIFDNIAIPYQVILTTDNKIDLKISS